MKNPEAVNFPNWQPIETAPKDGTEILLYGDWVGETGGVGPLNVVLVGAWRGGSDYPGYDWDVSGTDALAAWMKASHWMPLPAPPTTPDRQGERE